MNDRQRFLHAARIIELTSRDLFEFARGRLHIWEFELADSIRCIDLVVELILGSAFEDGNPGGPGRTVGLVQFKFSWGIQTSFALHSSADIRPC
jgi:hypothetical protein